ncbi:MAG: dacC [Bacteroidetes bacterium]|nr:dacC [Bacteroidota bacterium]
MMQIMKHFFLKILLWLTFVPFLGAQNDSSAVKQFISSPVFKHALVGFCVKDFNGKTLYAYNQDKLLTPASIMKVVTTASALEILGDDYRYKTKLSFSEQDSTLVITGSGDPTLGSEYSDEESRNFLSKWSSEIKDKKFSKKTFHLLIDDSLFGYDGISQQWTWEDIGNYYAAGAYGISFMDNTYKIYFNTLADSSPVIVQLEPNIPGLTFQNNLQLNTSGQDNGYIHGIPFSCDRRITGNIPAGRSSFSIKGDIPDPGLFLAKSLTDEFRLDGMSVVDYRTVRGQRFQLKPLTPFYEHVSSPLKDIVRQINVRSNNHYAEHVIRTIGVSDVQDALKNGINRIQSFWKSKGFDTSSLLMYDGCGLSPEDGVTPEFMTDVLVKMQQGKNQKSFFESLPKVGEEGTVRNFLKETHLCGKVRAKSGSISGVQCFAGYFIDGDRKYAFTVMVNKFEGPRKDVLKNIEELLQSVF